jgi:hypothetical protein
MGDVEQRYYAGSAVNDFINPAQRSQQANQWVNQQFAPSQPDYLGRDFAPQFNQDRAMFKFKY